MPGGRKLAEFGQTGSGEGEFQYPASIAVSPDGRVYVGDFNNSRVQVFNTGGRYVETLPHPGDLPTVGVVQPAALAVDHAGNLYVSDINRHQVMVFDANGRMRTRFGKPGKGEGELAFANGIAVGERGAVVYVADSNNGRIQVFSTEGQFQKSIAMVKGHSLVTPRGLALDEDRGVLYIADTITHTIYVYETASGKAAAIGEAGSGKQAFSFPNGLALDAAWQAVRGGPGPEPHRGIRLCLPLKLRGGDGAWVDAAETCRNSAFSLLLAILVLAAVFINLIGAGAADIIVNGNFMQDLSEWMAVGDLSVVWQPDGFAGGQNGDGMGGYLRLSTLPGEQGSVWGDVYQEFSIGGDNPEVLLGFAWAKEATGSPARQAAGIRLSRPGGQTVTLWSDESVSDSVYGHVNGPAWQAERMDISAYLPKAGLYRLELYAELANGGGPGDETAAAFDEVFLQVSHPDREPPTAPGGLRISDPRTGGRLDLRWQANSEIDLAGYYLYREKDGEAFTRISPDPVAVAEFHDTGLTDDTIYRYKVTAVDWAGNESVASATVAGAPTLDATPPEVPAGLRAHDPQTGNLLELWWRAVDSADLAGYILYRGEDAKGPFTPVAGLLTRNDYSDDDVLNDRPYYYAITAVDTTGNESARSAVVQAVPTRDTTPPAVPAWPAGR